MAAMRLDSIICKGIVYQVGNIQAGNVQCRQIDKNRTVFESETISRCGLSGKEPVNSTYINIHDLLLVSRKMKGSKDISDFMAGSNMYLIVIIY